ncbi:zinc-binding dehydrogenase [Lachnospiraceae bacterium ASD3451]|uniref:zinc-binding dehydrogenase n=1 Tax=Diplocloster agilis TaxID=2850323 RepID=UPI001DC6B128|nr:zinc-binding dehydrogenase [Diplocloster agilis]MBU9742885.1 zinc-binding dehydrogenase [Diplocloster agilis]
MRTKGVRIYGVKDLRLEEFELPPMGEDEMTATIYTDSICMSTYKVAIMGKENKRVPEDIDRNPILIGHEFCGVITGIGEKWKDKYQIGQRFVMQTSLNVKGSLAAPGFSFPYVGGDATHIVIPNIVMERDCIIKYEGSSWFRGCMAEPMGCIGAGFDGCYHVDPETREHRMGISPGGAMAILGGCGPMGLGCIDYALHCDNHPHLVVVTDVNEERLARAKRIFTKEKADKQGVRLEFLNSARSDVYAELMRLSPEGYQDVFNMTPVASVAELADQILANDGCHMFFAGPTDQNLRAKINLYNVHYAGTHTIGVTGGTLHSMKHCVEMMSAGQLHPEVMITHIGGLDAVVDTTLNLPSIPGGKKLIYNQIRLPLTALTDFEALGKSDPMFRQLDEIVKANDMLWCEEAEQVLMQQALPI